jgi:hypothetical protein
VCTALLVPFTTLCATFLAVFALLFATFFAVLTGPDSTVPMEMAKARIIENNAFIVLNDSFLTASMRLSDGRLVAAPESFRGWARQDSNLGPRDYESPALTAELQAHLPMSNGVSCKAQKSLIDFMLTFSICLSIFPNHEKTEASSA